MAFLCRSFLFVLRVSYFYVLCMCCCCCGCCFFVLSLVRSSAISSFHENCVHTGRAQWKCIAECKKKHRVKSNFGWKWKVNSSNNNRRNRKKKEVKNKQRAPRQRSNMQINEYENCQTYVSHSHFCVYGFGAKWETWKQPLLLLLLLFLFCTNKPNKNAQSI